MFQKKSSNLYYLSLIIFTISSIFLIESFKVSNIPGLIYLVGLISFTSLFNVKFNKVKITFQTSIVLAGFLLFGEFEAILLIVASTLLKLEKNNKSKRIQFSFLNHKTEDIPNEVIDIMVSITSLVYGMKAFTLLGGNTFESFLIGTKSPLNTVILQLPALMIPIIIYLIVFMTINAVLVLFYLKYVLKLSDLNDVIRDMIKSTPILILVDLTGVLLAISYISTNWVFSTLLIAPLSIAGIAMQFYYNLIDSHIKTSKAMTESLEAKDQYTSGHSLRVQKYCALIAEKLKLSRKDVRRLEFASLMHDVGKIGVNDGVLNKIGKLNDDEFDQIKAHSTIGAKIISNFDNILFNCSNIIKFHHLYFDGTGYPQPAQDEDIPFLAGVIAVSDALDAMTSDRPYRKALSLDIAMKEISINSGTQFDPLVVDVFLALCEDETITQELITKLNKKTNTHNLSETKKPIKKTMTAV